jgi:hypothetical protein
MKIQNVWINKNVDLESLAEHVESFFRTKSFATKRKENDKQYDIFITGCHKDGSHVKMNAKIFRDKDKLFVELSAGEQGILSKLDGLTNLFAGGYVVLQKIKSEETLDKLESEFYNYINQVILDITGEAGSKTEC